MLKGETLHSMLPQDIPWWMPDHAVFFGALYAVLIAIVIGLACVLVKSMKDVKATSDH